MGDVCPCTEFNRDRQSLTYIGVCVATEAFLYHNIRRVDKDACISFRDRKYETKLKLIGYVMQIAYVSVSPDTIAVSYPGVVPFQIKPVKIGRYCDKNPTLPVRMQGQKLATFHFLGGSGAEARGERVA